MNATQPPENSNSGQPAGLGLNAQLGPNAQDVESALRELDDTTNQTWRGKRARWAALVRAQATKLEDCRARILELEAVHEDASGAVLQEREQHDQWKRELRQMAEDSADRGDVFAQRVLRALGPNVAINLPP